MIDIEQYLHVVQFSLQGCLNSILVNVLLQRGSFDNMATLSILYIPITPRFRLFNILYLSDTKGRELRRTFMTFSLQHVFCEASFNGLSLCLKST